MELIQAKNVFNRLDRLVNVVNTTIGVIKANYEVLNYNQIVFHLFYEKDSEVGKFLIENIMNIALQNDYPFTIMNTYNGIDFIYYVAPKDNFIPKCNDYITYFILDLIYQVIDMAKVEYCLIIEKLPNKEIPLEITFEVDQWNEDQEYYGEDMTGSFVDYDDIKQYRINKNCLYGISLGYYDIDMSIVESDLVPELIGVLFESVEDFCYVTSDKDYIYLYSVVPFNDDTEFDIEEGLINCLHLLSQTNQEETLDDLWGEWRQEGGNNE